MLDALQERTDDTIDGVQATGQAGAAGPSGGSKLVPPTTERKPENLVAVGSGAQLPLFETTEGAQAGIVAPRASLDERAQARRRKLLEALARQEFATVLQRVGYVLQHNPETRDSDTAMALKYWLHWQPEQLTEKDVRDLEVLYELDNIGTLTRARRLIQNRLELFRGCAEAHRRRVVAQYHFSQLLAKMHDTDAELRIYLDETASDHADNYVGIGGICVLDWRYYEVSHAALRHWRDSTGAPETIHFADLDANSRGLAARLLAELGKRRAGLLFFGYRVRNRGVTDRAIANLIVQLVVDALDYAARNGCLAGAKNVLVVKEANEGFDRFYRAPLMEELADRLSRDCSTSVRLIDVQCVPKGREVLLECADLIAAAMRRRDLYGTANPKDRLAEAVYNVTGFDDVRGDHVLFRLFGAS